MHLQQDISPWVVRYGTGSGACEVENQKQDISPWVVRYGTGSGACEVENQRLSVPNAPYALFRSRFPIPCSRFSIPDSLGAAL
ncbi:MAG: hypothetical protein F6J90_41465 [Moorea sp. SIOASIH]|uniref:hypothetical protein n=1 Tax=Moorena sp. SIOASIH TaxID=2607817 RepID=UPI0013B65053|nr:hypothetical protein [Moorena sp. SIOASIH]NEO42445.1 hypothetical protein [Moorena sp. SIOASIH]